MKRIFSLLIFCISLSAFAEVTIINPVPGAYANPQTLVIEANDGEEIYYSFTGSDPLSSGFAYDGPVLLDVTGKVNLRIAVIDKNFSRAQRQIEYTVTDYSTENTEHRAFFDLLESGSTVQYTAGNRLSIPFTLGYSFGENKIIERGREISIARSSAVERFLPISFFAENNVWRYVLHILPASAGELSVRSVPFTITDWTKLIVTDPKIIFSVDGQWWHRAGEVVILDRSVPNTVYVQSASYSADNTVTRYFIPAKPELKTKTNRDGSVVVYIEDKDYLAQSSDVIKISPSPRAKTRLVARGLYPEINLSTFDGDKIDTIFPFDIYASGVYQGTLSARISIDRTTPAVPQIRASTASTYARDNVVLIAVAPKYLKMYSGLCEPIEIQPGFKLPDISTLDFVSPKFKPYDGEEISLLADREKILAYKIIFYTENERGIKSDIASHTVIIDKYNYYVDASSTAENPDGSPFAPYKDLSCLANIVNANSFSRFLISGRVGMVEGRTNLYSNVEILGTVDAQIEVPENSTLVMRRAGLYCENILWEKVVQNMPPAKIRSASKSLANIFVLESGSAIFKNCEIVGGFAGDGTVFGLTSSVLSITGTSIAASAEAYSSAIAAVNSRVSLTNTRVLCVGETSVAFSANGGMFDLSKTFVQVTGRAARGAEFIGGTISMVENHFSAENSSPDARLEMIYTTDTTTFANYKGNIYNATNAADSGN